MKIIMNENEWAEEMIQAHDLGDKPFETLHRVARYYLDQGYPKKEVHSKLDEFILRCDSYASLPRWSETEDQALKYACKHKAIMVDGVTISKTELEKIAGLNGRMVKRLAFVLLCLAKFHMQVNPDSNYWINNPDNEIFSLANIKTSIKRQCFLYHTLLEEGMIQFPKKIDNASIRVLFLDNGEPELSITDFRNLGYQYLMYCGEPFFECEECGIVTKLNDPRNKRRQKYCNTCAVQVRTKQQVEAVMRFRDRDSENCVIN